MDITTKSDAIIAGLRFYFTGKPCLRDHIAERFVHNGLCRDCSRMHGLAWAKRNNPKTAAQKRKWRAENPERDRENDRRWKLNNPDKIRAKNVATYAKHKERELARNKKWRETNPDRESERRRIWRLGNLESERQKDAEWARLNPDKRAAKVARRRAAFLRAIPPWANHDDILAVYELARAKTAETGIEHVVDHIVPLQGKTVCGLHTAANLRAITDGENARKNNKLIEELALAA